MPSKYITPRLAAFHLSFRQWHVYSGSVEQTHGKREDRSIVIALSETRTTPASQRQDSSIPILPDTLPTSQSLLQFFNTILAAYTLLAHTHPRTTATLLPCILDCCPCA